MRAARPAAEELGVNRPLKYNLLLRSRETLAVDLKQPAGRELVLRLVEKADVMTEGFRPGVTERLGLGTIVFSPMAQGLLSDKYLNGIPKDSRAAASGVFLKPKQITDDTLTKIRKLNDIAKDRGQSLAQMALAWVLRFPSVTSALIGASRPEQIKENVDAIKAGEFTKDQLEKIEAILSAM